MAISQKYLNEGESVIVSTRTHAKALFVPIIVLLGLNGLAVGILNVHDHFAIPAIAPLSPW